VLAELARAVGRVTEDLGAGRLVFNKAWCLFGVASVAGREGRGGDDARLGLSSKMGLEAVSVGMLCLVGMA